MLGPAIVHEYRWDAAWYYILAELVGGALAGLAAVPLYGGGPFAWWAQNDEVRSRKISKGVAPVEGLHIPRRLVFQKRGCCSKSSAFPVISIMQLEVVRSFHYLEL